MASILHRRLLQDIAQIQTKPYPNIALHLQDDDISSACLILTTEGYGPMHLTVCFNDDYPLSPPKIYMDSKIIHPNIKEEGNICASILETQMDYTPAYTLKGIAMQLLSSFSSERIQQV
jgi:ubiquitin-protein ligase